MTFHFELLCCCRGEGEEGGEGKWLWWLQRGGGGDERKAKFVGQTGKWDDAFLFFAKNYLTFCMN